MPLPTVHLQSASAAVKMEPASGLSLRGAKRRGNLAVSGWITGKFRRNRNCLPEIAPQGHFLALRAQGATAPLGPRNDKSESFTPQNAYRKSCQSAWRSLSAATDAIGACHFNDSLYGSGVRSREGHAPPLHNACGRRECPGICWLPPPAFLTPPSSRGRQKSAGRSS